MTKLVRPCYYCKIEVRFYSEDKYVQCPNCANIMEVTSNYFLDKCKD